jgi:hypothetical protein
MLQMGATEEEKAIFIENYLNLIINNILKIFCLPCLIETLINVEPIYGFFFT